MIESPLCLSLRVYTTKYLLFNHRIDFDQAEKALSILLKEYLTLQSKSNSFEPIYTIVRGPFNKVRAFDCS